MNDKFFVFFDFVVSGILLFPYFQAIQNQDFELSIWYHQLVKHKGVVCSSILALVITCH